MDLLKKRLNQIRIILKALQRCKSRRRSASSTTITAAATTTKPPPDGCFAVYVGDQKQRFFVKTKSASHPLFKTLLEDAETEYGYNSQGPIELPCHVDLFYHVLAAMDGSDVDIDADAGGGGGGWNGKLLGRRSPFSNSNFRRTPPSCEKGSCGYYVALTPSPMLKLNELHVNM